MYDADATALLADLARAALHCDDVDQAEEVLRKQLFLVVQDVDSDGPTASDLDAAIDLCTQLAVSVDDLSRKLQSAKNRLNH